MHTSAIVVAAGRGLRLRAKISKPLVEINSKPIIIYSLNTLSSHPDIKDIIVVVNRENLRGIKGAIKKYRVKKIKALILGGKLRRDSVNNGLKAVGPKTDSVLIHDAARPFLDKNIVSSAIKEAEKYGAAIVGVPVKATIKKIQNPKSKIQNRFIAEKTMDRKNLWEIQTPQVFRKDLILAAYQKFGKTDVTDDAMLVEKMGIKVRIVPGAYNNIKITTPEDLIIAKAIARIWKTG